MSKRSWLAAIASASLLSSAHAVILSNTQVLLTPTTEYGANYAITTVQAPDYFDPTTLWFRKADGAGTSTLTPITWNVDQEADYYLAHAGAVLTSQTVASGQFTPLFTTDRPYSLDVSRPGDFYLAVATSPAGSGASGPRNIWGWVHLRNDASGLSVLGSAMAYGEGGIVVGTTTPVPEAATFMQMGMGLAAVALFNRARQRRGTGQTASA